MEAVLAVIVGLVVGSGLAAAVAFPLRRRFRRDTDGSGRTRRLPLQTANQRHRAAIVATAFVGGALLAQLAGWTLVSAYLMLAAVFMTVQVATSAIMSRPRPRQ